MNPSSKSKQREKLLKHLFTGQVLRKDTGRLLFRVRRCAARISELRIADLRNPRGEGGGRR